MPITANPTTQVTQFPTPFPSTGVHTTEDWVSYPSLNDIRSLAFASDGSLWAGTGSGVVRWDLATDTHIRYSTTDGLVSDDVTDLAFAPDGTLWVAARGGVSHFDGTSWRAFTEADGLISNIVYAIAVAPDGSVWMGTPNGASHFNGAVWTSYTMADGLADNVVWYVAVAPDGNVWFSTHSGGVSRYDPGQNAWTTYSTEHGLPLPNARFLAIGPNGAPWLHIGYDHVYRFDGATWEVAYEPGGGQWVCDIAFDAGGLPWIATCGGYHAYGAGLAHFDGGTWTYATAEDALVDNDVTAVAVVPDGTIAAGSDRGLSVYQAGRWRTLRSGPTLSQVTTVTVTHSMKGYELYSWQEGEGWYFALVVGTNRIKTFDEIVAPEVRVRGIEALEVQLDQLASGERVFWSAQRVPNVVLPPDDVVEQVQAYCEQRGIELEIEPSTCSGPNAFPIEEAELIWPELREVQPDRVVPGDEVEILGVGGHLYWDNECGEFWLESARDFQLFFDGEPAGFITCYANMCVTDLTVPVDALPGTHVISVEGGSSLSIEVGGQPTPSPTPTAGAASPMPSPSPTPSPAPTNTSTPQPTATAEANANSVIHYFRANVEEADPGDTIVLEWNSSGGTPLPLKAILYHITPSGQLPQYGWEVAPSGVYTYRISPDERNLSQFSLYVYDEAERSTGANLTVRLRCPDAWFFSPAPQGCASEPVLSNAAEQHFERGIMIWVEDATWVEEEASIFVLYDDDQYSPKWERFTDEWDEGEPDHDPALIPPAGLYQPVRGFGLVWRERPNVRARLGWAVDQETGFSTIIQSTTLFKYNSIYLRAFDGRKRSGVWHLEPELSSWEKIAVIE